MGQISIETTKILDVLEIIQIFVFVVEAAVFFHRPLLKYQRAGCSREYFSTIVVKNNLYFPQTAGGVDYR